ncbi:hypothetical protein EJ110_NYTH42785 [Nymphaea thermarum]|nr:hypothetical protein EJ110_NYTH42785 [Nymphaea thermarum]
MAESSSSIVNTGQTEVGDFRTENMPVQVTTIRLTKENYFQWSAAMTMGIAGRGKIAYINGRKIEPAETNVAWDTWFLEDNQIRELRAYLNQIDVGQAEVSYEVKVNHALAISGEKVCNYSLFFYLFLFLPSSSSSSLFLNLQTSSLFVHSSSSSLFLDLHSSLSLLLLLPSSSTFIPS